MTEYSRVGGKTTDKRSMSESSTPDYVWVNRQKSMRAKEIIWAKLHLYPYHRDTLLQRIAEIISK